MGLFGREERTDDKSPSTADAKPRDRNGRSAGAIATLVAKETTIEGEIKGSGDVRIEGTLKGKLDCTAEVHVAEGGLVEADLKAENVSVAGRVVGNIAGTRKIELGPTAEVEGDITSPRILIREGATFEGQVFMTGKKTPKNPEPEKKADKPSEPESKK
jgi:cytoskeletal protein CcmA (bactofilin family)